jgi:hypothetical protein
LKEVTIVWQPRFQNVVVLAVLGLLASAGVPLFSDAHRRGPVIVELFTSQGCSTCPPADHLLSEVGRRGSGGEVIPLAFHVDYWDRLGWADPFSSPLWSRRQEAYARALHHDHIVTPQFLIAGWDDYVGSQRDELARKIAVARGKAPAAELELSVSPGGPSAKPADGGAGVGDTATLKVNVAVRLLQQVASPNLELWVAVTQSGMSTAVQGGENKSATLHDDYVVRRMERALALTGQTAERRVADLDLALDPSWPRADLTVAAFLQDPASMAILGAAASRIPSQP